MAYNPYKRDDGEGIVSKALKLPVRAGSATIRTIPTWAPRVAAGQGIRAAGGAYSTTKNALNKINTLHTIARSNAMSEYNRLHRLGVKAVIRATNAQQLRFLSPSERPGAVMAKSQALAHRTKRWVYEQTMKGAPKVSETGRKIVSAVDSVRGAGNRASGAIKNAVSAVKEFGGNAARAVNPLGQKATSVAKTLGKWAVAKPASGTAKLVSLPPKGIVKGVSKTFGLIEKAGEAITAGNSGRAARVIRGATKASGLAGGFAVGAWLDAGVKAYEFYANGGKMPGGLSGEKRVETVNGKQVQMTDPSLLGIVFSWDYLREALKGAQSALTLGLTGHGDDTYLDRAFEKSQEEEQKELDAIMESNLINMKDIHGNAVYSAEDRRRRNDALKADETRRLAAQKFMKDAAGSLDVQNFRSMVDGVSSRRKTAMDSMEANIRNFEDFSKTLRRPMPADQYRESATAKANSDYDRQMRMLLGNKVAQDVMKENRRAAYGLYGIGSGDYDADVANATGDRLAAIREFNQMWEPQSDAEKAAWNREDEAKAMMEVAANYKPEEVQDGQ